MKAFFLIFCFILSGVNLSAQNAKIDSLQQVIETTKSDTVKGRSLCRLCDEQRKTGDYDTGMKKGEEGLKISEKEKDEKGIASCLNNIGIIYSSQGNYPKALEYYQKSLKIREQIGDKNGISACLNNMGAIYLNQGNYPKALECHHKSLMIKEQIKEPFGMAACLNNIGTIYFNLGNYPKALEHHQKAMQLFEQKGANIGVAECLNNLGNIYISQNNFSSALGYYQKSLKIYEENNKKGGIAQSLINMGIIYHHQNNYSQALACFQRALDINTQIGNQQLAAVCLTNIGAVYEQKRDYPRSLEYYQKSLQIDEQFGKTENSTILSNIGNVYLQMNQPLIAKSHARKGLAVAQESKNLEEMQWAVNVSFQIDSALGDYQSAFEHHKLFKQYSDSLHNEDKAKEFGRIESRYQFEKEAEEQKRKQAEAKRKEQLETDRRNNLQYLSIFAGLLVLFGGLAFVGRLNIPVRILEIGLFASLLILFEFLLILFDPILDDFTGGIPIQKLIFNSLIALGFAPLHGFLEGKLKKRFASRVEEN